MEKKFKYYVGVDVSKNTLDYSVVKENKEVLCFQSENSDKGIKSFIKELKSKGIVNINELLFCAEHTGIYNNPLVYFLKEKGGSIWLESALHIKRSIGMQRGKNDKVDAQRIAMFAYKNREDAKIFEAPREVIRQLKGLSGLRSQLIEVVKGFNVRIKEIKGFESKELARSIEGNCKKTIAALNADLKRIEQEIQNIIQSDEYLNQLFTIIKSVDGVGNVTATEVIISTNEFKNINDPRKFACYCGVVPFDHSSGTSVRGKSRVSSMANKVLKTLFHMSALSAIRVKGEFKDYFERKIKEGKNKMSVINAIRSKIIHRIFACIRDNRLYQKEYSNLFV